MADPTVWDFLVQVLCAHGGRMTLDALLAEIALPRAQLRQVLEEAGPDRFVLLQTRSSTGSAWTVVANTRARVCRRKVCERGCDNLHLCKLNLLGRCHYLPADRKLCKYSHEVFSKENSEVLKRYGLSKLNQEELAVLLVQSDSFFIPEICKDYKGEGRKQTCSEHVPCERLHICEHFTRGNCRYLNCNRSHNLMDKTALSIMREHGLSPDMVQNIQDICNNKHVRRNPPRSRAPSSNHRAPQASRGRSKSRDRCYQASPEFISSAYKSCTPGPDGTGFSAFVEDDVHLFDNFSYVWSKDQAQPSSASSKVASLGATAQAGGSQRASKDDGLHDFSYRNHADSTSNQAVSSSLLAVTKTSNAITSSKGLGIVASDHVNVKGKSGTQDIQEVLLKHQADGVATDLTCPRSANYRAATNDQREITLPRNHQNNGSAFCDLQATGKITDGGNNPGLTFLNGLGLERAVTGEKEAFSLRSKGSPRQVPATPGIATASTKVNTLPQSSLPSSISRAADYGAQGPAHTPVSSTNEHSQRTTVSSQNSMSGVSSITSTMNNVGPKEICLDYLYLGCQLAGNCNKIHFHLPYQWQVLISNTWLDLQAMEQIEEAYCDPEKPVLLVKHGEIDFQKMLCGFRPIRRLSTPSAAIQELANSVFTTKWLWYWRHESGKWIQYGAELDNQPSSDIDSSYLESLYQFCPRGVVPFQAGSKKYELSFQGMIQTNIASMTQKDVIRRPVFVSSLDVVRIRRGGMFQSLVSKSEAVTPNVPPQQAADSSNAYELLELSSNCGEYAKVREHFKNSMKNFRIEKIKKINNQKLLDTFERKKLTMNRKEEKLLFYATRRAHVDSICADNFDYSHGTHEDKYGKGNYFAKEAFHFHKSYGCDTKNTVMFIARVLVGDFIEGHKEYTRPPPMYDSCVDTRLNPNVYVIFEKSQTYPAYLIEYVETEKSCVIS
ncbi:zinc finger CCCH-type antiviral protein 1-like [Perognathus longimembris pacificus]|uniref:zinc finger CCCH-type antiviral protein 1-like n=1 Tax=Perognathus longimembris pacificus TaxID=214514 RepID=UPI002018EBFF|nr:zinc finger CCCH-type antiviral protein 1-like [Perognathus longimembris pacificus]